MITISHVSDLHFHTGSADNQNATALLEKVKRCHSQPTDYLIVTGDITDDGDVKQYKNASTSLAPFVNNLLLVPGNHDYGTCGCLYLADRAKAFDRFASGLGLTQSFTQKQPKEMILDDGAGTTVVTIGLNSIIQTPGPLDLDFARGEIGNKQLKALQNILSNPGYATFYKLVYLHHRPLRCNGWFLDMVDADDLMGILNQFEVDAVLFGHSGGSMRESEPAPARIVQSITRPFGVKYLLNANSSVAAGKFNQITFDPKGIDVKTL